MKKMLLILVGIYTFAFNVNKNYSCETLGFSFKKNGKIYNVANDIRTNKQMQKDLGKLYQVSFIPVKNAIKLKVEDKNDTLPYVQSIKNKIDVYITKDKQVLMFVDKNTSQIAIKIPIKQLVIYYKCKEK
jgi:hypothetical protein